MERFAKAHVARKMHMRKAQFLALAASALLFGQMTLGFAAEETTTFGVSGTVVANCNISANALSFGTTIDVLPATVVDTTTTIAVTCTNGTTYDIGLDAGAGSGATVTTRKMTKGTDTINYSLYSDAGHATVWGTTVGTDTVADTGTGLEQTLTVYGRIDANQTTALPGAYSDTITVTVTY